jgi:DTW domain-containing protein YfiP
VLILQHPMEVRAAKGTARLLHLCLPQSAIAVGEAFDPDALRAMLYAGGRMPVLLYPPTDSAAGRYAPESQPSRVRLVVLDGTWRKSRKMLHLNPLLLSLPRLSLDDVPPSAYRIRKAHAEHQLSTLEAAALAIAALDPNAGVGPLLDGFDAFIDQQAAFAGR